MSQGKENTGIHLITKSKKGIFSAIFSRFGLLLVLMLIQILFFFTVFRWFEAFLPHIYGGTIVFTILMILYLLNSSLDPTAKITWLVIILPFPLLGSLLYLYTQQDVGHRALKSKVHQITVQSRGIIPQSPETRAALEKKYPGIAGLSRYISRSGCFPVYENTDVTYFPTGEDKFREMLQQLQKAEHFIFMEYFIVKEGLMWGQVLEILAQKAAQGVDVRVMYDGMCEISSLPHDYPKRLRKLGIKCKAFAPLSPFVSTYYNYRDHRKILVIDGHTAFTGGINLADEYINRIDRFGYWKDTAVMVKGDAVPSFTLMFLQMWALDAKKTEFHDFLSYPTHSQKQAGGFVIPYGDCPLDSEKVGEQVYIDMLNRAQRYVHITTPYLILDGEMENALKFAAERGVDVRLILPGIPDKFIPYSLALTHYASLMSAGIKIYEYTPGFVHAKSFVCDDREAVVGTINLDYRSLYHHFECALYMFQVGCISHIEQDFLHTMEKCRMVTRESIKKEKLSRKLIGVAMKAVAPLL